ncbi:MAG: hypothetical protein OIN87_06005 [Candidatus Methanoperedens sp.]|nr:hypothetical protein [Candidatus Methanoperedens sp.]
MRFSRSKYEKIDAVSKFTGLILLALCIDNVSKGNYYLALFLFGLGGMIGIMPIFFKVD